MSPLPNEQPHVLLLIDGEGSTELTESEAHTMRAVLRVIRGEKADGAHDNPLTTGEAAQILGISRRQLTRYLDADAIPYQRYGNGHRSLRLEDVLAFKEGREHRHGMLDKMHEHAAAAGMYESEYADAMFEYFGVE